jgi:hypothetical protein
VHKAVAPESVGLSKRELNASAERICDGDWVGKAVRSTIDRKTATIFGGVAVASSGGGGGSS